MTSLMTPSIREIITLSLTVAQLASSDGVCMPCAAPGKRRLLPCSDDNPVNPCVDCDVDTFSPGNNAGSKCPDCRKDCEIMNQVVVSPCTPYADTGCECRDGFYMKEKHDLACTPHTECLPGSGAIINGTAYSDSICEQCPSGSFSNVTSSKRGCVKHRKCTAGVKVAGDRFKDNICKEANSDKINTLKTSNVTIIVSVIGSLAIVVLLGALVYLATKCRKNSGPQSMNNLNSRAGSSVNTSTRSSFRNLGDAEDPLSEKEFELKLLNGVGGQGDLSATSRDYTVHPTTTYPHDIFPLNIPGAPSNVHSF